MHASLRIPKLWAFAASVALCVCAFGQGSTPADAARSQTLGLFNIFKARDWKALYRSAQFSDSVQKGLTNEDDFARDFQKGLTGSDPDNVFGKLMDSMTEIKVGMVIITDNHAVVSTTCKVGTVMFLGIASLIKSGDSWKWDLAWSDDVKQVVAQRMTELLGAPATEK